MGDFRSVSEYSLQRLRVVTPLVTRFHEVSVGRHLPSCNGRASYSLRDQNHSRRIRHLQMLGRGWLMKEKRETPHRNMQMSAFEAQWGLLGSAEMAASRGGPRSRLSGVVLYPGLKDSGIQGLGRRTRCRGLSEMPTEGDYRPVEASTSPDGASSEGEANVESTSDQPFFQDLQIDLDLPRRRMLVEFTCNACNSRTQRVINPEAYRRGTVFVQCGGCEVYHQLVDNLSLIQEFDFREDDGLSGV